MVSSDGELFASKYKLEKLVGQGAYGEVYEAISVSNSQKVAVKIFFRNIEEKILKSILKEVEILSKLSNPNILKILAFGHTKHQGNMVYYIITPFMPKSLDQILKDKKKLGLQRILEIILEICIALEYLHKNKVVHRDIKPQNILCDGDKIILADFGIACQVDKTQTKAAGSLLYCAPEQLDTNFRGDARMDIYSLGIMFYEMATGKNPYLAIAEKQGQAAALHFKYMSEYSSPKDMKKDVNPILNYIIKKMIRNEASNRFFNVKDLISSIMPLYKKITKDDKYKSYKIKKEKISKENKERLKDAVELLGKKKFDKAVDICEEILDDMPSCYQAYYYLGWINWKMGNSDFALEAIESSLIFNPNYYAALCKKGYICTLLENFDEAEKVLEKAISIKPVRKEALFFKSIYHKYLYMYYRDKSQGDLSEENYKLYENLQKSL